MREIIIIYFPVILNLFFIVTVFLKKKKKKDLFTSQEDMQIHEYSSYIVTILLIEFM